MSSAAIRRVIAARSGAPAVRATYGGTPGHPVLLERELFEPLRNVSGDKGARNLLLSVQVLDVPCDDLGGGEDVDTRAELDALRSGGPVTGAPR
jgi:CTP:molybdopterin cytidylyltransferase MocA